MQSQTKNMPIKPARRRNRGRRVSSLPEINTMTPATYQPNGRSFADVTQAGLNRNSDQTVAPPSQNREAASKSSDNSLIMTAVGSSTAVTRRNRWIELLKDNPDSGKSPKQPMFDFQAPPAVVKSSSSESPSILNINRLMDWSFLDDPIPDFGKSSYSKPCSMTSLSEALQKLTTAENEWKGAMGPQLMGSFTDESFTMKESTSDESLRSGTYFQRNAGSHNAWNSGSGWIPSESTSFSNAFAWNQVNQSGFPIPAENNFQDLTLMQPESYFLDDMNTQTLASMAVARPNGETLFSRAMSGKPELLVIPLREINFSNQYIQFSVTAINAPHSCQLTSTMMEAMACSPSGVMIPGMIKSNPRTPDVFGGSFKANHEVGIFTLKVRLVLPFNFYSGEANSSNSGLDFGVMGETIKIVVSRNYFRESQGGANTNTLTLELDLTVKELLPDGRPILNSKAWGITCDTATNRLYYAERGAHRITCVDPTTGQMLFRFNCQTGESKLNRPTGICFDAVNRRVIVCDKDNHRISFFTLDGEYISSFGVAGYQNGMFSFPWDVDVDALGTHIVVADSRNKRVQLFDRNGFFLNKFSVFETNPFEFKNYFDYPRGVTFDKEGQKVYVTDFNTHNVLEVPVDFSTSKRLCPEGKLRRPQGIIMDAIGTLIVADSRNNCLRHLTGDGKHLCTIRTVGTNEIMYPVNMSLMPGGNVALLDGNGRIHIF